MVGRLCFPFWGRPIFRCYLYFQGLKKFGPTRWPLRLVADFPKTARSSGHAWPKPTASSRNPPPPTASVIGRDLFEMKKKRRKSWLFNGEYGIFVPFFGFLSIFWTFCPSFPIWDWIQKTIHFEDMVLKNLSTIANHEVLINLHHVVYPKSTTFFVESLQGTGSLLQLFAVPAQENQHLKRYTSLLHPLNVTTAGVQDTLFAHHQLLY